MAVLPNSRGPAHSEAHEWQRQLLPPAIGRCIVLSKLRCLVTLVSFVLLVSDIPRTGLGVKRLADFYGASVLPGSAVRFGPYAYPVAHIVQPANDSGSSAFTGSKGAKPIEATRVWSYKYDSTSIGLRGAVELLNVSAFPATLLYKDEDASNQASTLDLGTTFSMLDAFISSARAQLLLDVDVTLATCRLATKSLWIDRLQYYVTSFFATNMVWRLHSIHVPATIDQTKVFNICPATGTAAASRSRPCFCDHVVPWLCTNPLNASLPSVPLWRHLGLRLQGLQRRYPNVSLEMALLSSQKFAVSSGAMQSTYYNTETIEVVMLSRGRRCIDDGTSSEPQCTTVFVDDYRYESDIVQTDLEDWFDIIASLRSSAQCYVWVRLALLFYGAFVAADGSPSVVSRLQTATSIVLRVPFQVVVYGSVLPVVAYVLAHLLDSSFMDIFLEAHWSSVGGTNSDFSLVRFLNSTAVQMRNVWLLALLTNILLSVGRRNPFDSNEGVLGIRGLAISFTAMLSIFGSYKDPSFRNSVNTVVLRLADRGQRMETIKARPLPYLNTSPYCFDTSMTMMILSIGVAVVLASVVKALCALGSRCLPPGVCQESRDVIIGSTPIIPCGAGRLWPASALSIRFRVATRPPLPPTNACSALPSNCRVPPTPLSVLPKHDHASSRFCWRQLWAWRSRVVPSGSERPMSEKRVESPGGLRSRTQETSSVLQLMNIAMMTDPWTLVWLRMLGIQLFLYKIRCAEDTELAGSTSNRLNTGCGAYTVILPYRLEEMETHTCLGPDEYQLVGSGNSCHLSMAVMLQCG